MRSVIGIGAVVIGLGLASICGAVTARNLAIVMDVQENANLLESHKAYSDLIVSGVVTDSVAASPVDISGKTGTLGFKTSFASTSFWAEAPITIVSGPAGTWTATFTAANWATNITFKTRYFGDLSLSDFGAPLPSLYLDLHPNANQGDESSYVSPTSAGFETNLVLVTPLNRVNFGSGLTGTYTQTGTTNRLTIATSSALTEWWTNAPDSLVTYPTNSHAGLGTDQHLASDDGSNFYWTAVGGNETTVEGGILTATTSGVTTIIGLGTGALDNAGMSTDAERIASTNAIGLAYLPRDGSAAMTGDLPMGGNSITNVGGISATNTIETTGALTALGAITTSDSITILGGGDINFADEINGGPLTPTMDVPTGELREGFGSHVWEITGTPTAGADIMDYQTTASLITSATGTIGIAYLPRDGSAAMTGDLPMGGNDVTNVANVTASATIETTGDDVKSALRFGHYGDADTYLIFPQEDQVALFAGGTEFLHIFENGSQDKIWLGTTEGGDIDVIVRTVANENTIVARGSDGLVTINTDLALSTGATVDTIETTLTDDDTHLPTSGAVQDRVVAATNTLAAATGLEQVLNVSTNGGGNDIGGVSNVTATGTITGEDLTADDLASVGRLFCSGTATFDTEISANDGMAMDGTVIRDCLRIAGSVAVNGLEFGANDMTGTVPLTVNGLSSTTTSIPLDVQATNDAGSLDYVFRAGDSGNAGLACITGVGKLILLNTLEVNGGGGVFSSSIIAHGGANNNWYAYASGGEIWIAPNGDALNLGEHSAGTYSADEILFWVNGTNSATINDHGGTGGTLAVNVADSEGVSLSITGAMDFAAITADWKAGRLRYDPTNKTFQADTGFTNVSVNIGYENQVLFYNDTGLTITNGYFLNAQGATNGVLCVVLYDVATPGSAESFVGVCTVEAGVPDGQLGVATLFGNVTGDWSAFTEGNPVYGSTNGLGTETKPLYPNFRRIIGTILDNSTNGIMYVQSAVDKRNRLDKSYGFTSQGIGAGTYYKAGYYDAPASDANLSQASTNVNHGSANVAYGAHAFAVFSAAGSVDTGTVGLRVVGTSINDLGVRTADDVEILTTNIAATATDEYMETDKKWLGTIDYQLYPSGGTPTTYSSDFNYGYAKYEDYGNVEFTVVGIEAIALGNASDTNFDMELLIHRSTGWTYSAAAFVPGDGAIATWSTDMAPEDNIGNGIESAWKRTNLDQHVIGDEDEGVVLRITTGQNNTIQTMDIHITAVSEEL